MTTRKSEKESTSLVFYAKNVLLIFFVVLFIISEVKIKIPLVDAHLSNFSFTGMVSLIFLRNKKFLKKSYRNKVIVTVIIITSLSVLVELFIKDTGFLSSSNSVSTLRFTNTVDVFDALASIASGTLILFLRYRFQVDES